MFVESLRASRGRRRGGALSAVNAEDGDAVILEHVVTGGVRYLGGIGGQYAILYPQMSTEGMAWHQEQKSGIRNRPRAAATSSRGWDAGICMLT